MVVLRPSVLLLQVIDRSKSIHLSCMMSPLPRILIVLLLQVHLPTNITTEQVM